MQNNLIYYLVKNYLHNYFLNKVYKFHYHLNLKIKNEFFKISNKLFLQSILSLKFYNIYNLKSFLGFQIKKILLLYLLKNIF